MSTQFEDQNSASDYCLEIEPPEFKMNLERPVRHEINCPYCEAPFSEITENELIERTDEPIYRTGDFLDFPKSKQASFAYDSLYYIGSCPSCSHRLSNISISLTFDKLKGSSDEDRSIMMEEIIISNNTVEKNYLVSIQGLGRKWLLQTYKLDGTTILRHDSGPIRGDYIGKLKALAMGYWPYLVESSIKNFAKNIT